MKCDSKVQALKVRVLLFMKNTFKGSHTWSLRLSYGSYSTKQAGGLALLMKALRFTKSIHTCTITEDSNIPYVRHKTYALSYNEFLTGLKRWQNENMAWFL